jgi:DDE superfamily endonuclease
MLPMGRGCLEGVTHDYVRHGTTTLFAALNTATGKVVAQCKPRHRHQEFLAFLKHVDQAVPADLDVHLIVDNYATHKHPKGSVEGRSGTCANSLPASSVISSSTISTGGRSYGRRPPIQSSRKWLGYAKLFLGRNTGHRIGPLRQGSRCCRDLDEKCILQQLIGQFKATRVQFVGRLVT